jgi:prepilin-type N-terminal cleavage/methylation domain-containing protein
MTLQRESGFTIIEIIAVLIVLSIVSAYAVGRDVFKGASLPIRSELLKTHLRYAQSRAITSNIFWGIQTNIGGSAYWMFKYDGALTKIRLPDEPADDVDLSADGVAISPGTYTFDARGIPYKTTAADNPPGAVLAADTAITVTKGSDSATITITKNTGFIR